MCARRRRARADDGQLAAVDRLGGQLAGVGEDEHRAARRDRLERASSTPPGAAEDGRVDRAVRARGRRARGSTSTANTVVAAPLEHGAEQPADEAVADDEHAAARHALGAAEHAGERLDVSSRARRRPVGGQLDPRRCARTRSAKPPGTIVGSANCSQVDSCPARQRSHSPQRRVVDERDAAAVLELARRPRARAPCPACAGAELLDVRAAEPAGEDAHELAGPVRLGRRRRARARPPASRTTARTGVS